ncbi:Hydrolase OS=Tsukamurella paurometabola (strain ATCC 8368 / DSM / CCUG 35730 / CIP 100753 /JCM 10117 / KCTC 9821 / NBRC 16120 / NCIMB 702349 / NCTC 13040)OX=521096 GN=Tpau_1827 PE=4 SV=1 [Tsukamurella paurometabola]|uniref:Hydrolase n=1 Tax=Tsukamurella paurometabola (strain ATCC 8368 / DSM 20162 / CCUG 35730 / CIP 100753 / JCM 10117 / KCTC 9821 / NBRC 16120 / NCIMB 702349 / NCTC 13040) TaxID=521096 RepID=D5UMU8_TSUPD|nr:alpha/beta fold hydrolase [Tsukamurella paurometabola]ADG78445.1 hydrolase [Tsukamurella paurometabola DSM 20162]SUP31659.1 Carboxylesterase ybfK [Tsukamurella paurometabola]
MNNDAIERAYRAVLEDFGVPVERRILDGALARTHVVLCGHPAAPPIVCLPGGGATAASWYATASALARDHRVIAPDLPGDGGGSQPRGLRSRDQWADWIDEVLDALDVSAPALVGHSFGAQLAVDYALRRPGVPAAITLLDPTDVFCRMRPSTVLRAVPLLLAPSARRQRAYAEWETDGHWPPSAAFGRLSDALADGPRTALLRLVPRRPAADRLDALREVSGGVTVVVGERSKSHDGPRLVRAIAQRYPWMTVTSLPVAHHELPFAYRP